MFSSLSDISQITTYFCNWNFPSIQKSCIKMSYSNLWSSNYIILSTYEEQVVVMKRYYNISLFFIVCFNTYFVFALTSSYWSWSFISGTADCYFCIATCALQLWYSLYLHFISSKIINYYFSQCYFLMLHMYFCE